MYKAYPPRSPQVCHRNYIKINGLRSALTGCGRLFNWNDFAKWFMFSLAQKQFLVTIFKCIPLYAVHVPFIWTVQHSEIPRLFGVTDKPSISLTVTGLCFMTAINTPLPQEPLQLSLSVAVKIYATFPYLRKHFSHFDSQCVETDSAAISANVGFTFRHAIFAAHVKWLSSTEKWKSGALQTPVIDLRFGTIWLKQGQCHTDHLTPNYTHTAWRVGVTLQSDPDHLCPTRNKLLFPGAWGTEPSKHWGGGHLCRNIGWFCSDTPNNFQNRPRIFEGLPFWRVSCERLQSQRKLILKNYLSLTFCCVKPGFNQKSIRSGNPSENCCEHNKAYLQ